MYRYYIPHELKIGDISHLADNDSSVALKKGIKIEDIVEVETYTSVFQCVVTDISGKSIEIEVLEKIEDRKIAKQGGSLTIVQSISSEKKFGLFLEKIVEIGVTKIIPIVSEYTLEDEKDFSKNTGLWKKIIKDATDQSRNPYPPTLEEISTLSAIDNKIVESRIRIALSTEDVETKSLHQILANQDVKGSNIVVAIGPESGWSTKDLDVLKKMDFQFVRLEGNILRTETTALVISSIIKFVRGEV
ncbi:MAG: hypothetical protein UT34_C0002G0131 [candidate division WS6 bacterium GW2011_GWF2_39_15]|uniref:Ribosomal RNA small subunit methyltransferase E n=1 Tax=candidate division WS6 bacterium GW2011_GWF2_39_15 TaxID=1619100 RepID=A0A0G0MNJ8_9BACT|nr:MAG: hypothetical protein UT34_C0002G0131 [candidate division WS6 bacterium GW2011_GWF2_39_15]